MVIQRNWEKIRSECFSGRELPEQVFSDSTGKFLFFEFARAFSEGAWRLFATLASIYGDRAVLCRAVEPDANNYYEKNFGTPAEFSFSVEGKADAYVHKLHCWPGSSITDALAYRAEIVWWTGTSGAWACWGGRTSGLCVLRIALADAECANTVAPLSGLVPILSLDEALTDVVAGEISGEAMGAFERQMRRFYPQAERRRGN
jgi:hypothetical protein